MIKLEPFTADKVDSLNQAWSLHELVANEREWLGQVQAGTVERYASVQSAARSVVRIASNWEKIEARIIRRDRAAIGISTIIPEQQIVHPDAGSFKGSDIDYWLQAGESLEVHNEVVRQLLNKSHEKFTFATVIKGHPNPPQGFDAHMKALGLPESLTAGDTDDPFEIARNGAPAQLYVHRESRSA